MTVDFDQEDALERTAGDKDLLGEVLRFTLEDLPVLIEDMNQSLGEGRLQDLVRLAHKAKGTAGACGARRLYMAALDLELAGQKEETVGPELLDSLRRAYDAFRSEPEVVELASLDAGAEASIG